MLFHKGLKMHCLRLMTCVIGMTLASAAAIFGQSIKGSPEGSTRSQRVAATGRLTGTRELQQVLVWQTPNTAHLGVKAVGSRPRLLWQTDGTGSFVDSVRISDLDADGLPEILSLWRNGRSAAAVLRVFHWQGERQSFVELESTGEIDNVRNYRIVRLARPASRILVELRAESGPGLTVREYEVRGSKLFRVGGGPVVTTKGDSGIEGQAIISPVRPGPMRQGQSGSAPFKTTIVIWNGGNGREVARVETGSDGRFRVALPPGTYKVGSPAQTGRFLPRASEETVVVSPGKFAQVTISFDSGMR